MFRFSRVLLLSLAVAISSACQINVETPRPETAPAKTPNAQEAALQAAAANSDNPLAPYFHRSKIDEFNPDVTDEERLHPHPRRGGSLIVRMPTDINTLDPLLINAESEQIVITYLVEYPESLVHRDSETLEYMPKMAEYWTVRDYVERRSGTRIEGLITAQTSDTVSIAPGVGIWTFFKQDLLSSDTKAGVFKTRFGQTLRGKPTVFDFTVMIEERPTTAAITLAHDELSSWTDQIGEKERVRLSIKPRCIYEFKLRPGIQWHDGQPVTMQDMKTWFDSMRNPRVDCASLRIYYSDIEKMDLIDNMTAKFTYKKPYFQALDWCGAAGFTPTHIYQPDRFAGDPEGYAEFYNKNPMGQPGRGHYVGCGPYRLDHWSSGQEVVLVRNENYWACKAGLPWWDKERPYLDKIAWRVIREKTPTLREMENGEVDADFDVEPDTWFLPMTNSPQFTSRFVRATFMLPQFTYIAWNLDRRLFQDPQVRLALTMLIPREKILKVIHYGLGRVAKGPFFEEGPLADPAVTPVPYDPAAARRLLHGAGWIDRDGDGVLDKDGQKLEFEYMIHTAREYHAKIADIVKQNLGLAHIQLNVRKVDFTILGEAMRDHNFDSARMAWGGMIDEDPYQIWHSSQSKGRGSNYISYKNPVVDQLIEKGREEFDPIKRWAMFREVYRIIVQDQPMTFLFEFDQPVFYHRRYHGVKFYRVTPGYDYTEWYVADGATSQTTLPK